MAERLPGPRGPVDQVRTAIVLARTPAAAIEDLYRRFGPVVDMGRWRYRYVYLLGVEANRFILSEHPQNFRWREAMASLIPVDGETALVVSDGDEHRRRRRLVQPAFHTKRIQGYLDVMVDAVDAELDRWHEGETLDAYARLRPVVRRIAVRTLFGDTLGARADDIGESLQAAIDFLSRPIPLQLKVDLPWTSWHRAKTGRARADDIANAEIARRRGLPPDASDTGDLLSMLLASQDEEGAGLSDVEVLDQVVSLVAAGYETTGAAVGWAVHALLVNAGEWDRAAAEVDDVVGDDRLTVAHLQAMPHLDAVVNETLRLWPPGFVSARKTVEEFEFAGHTIPTGPLLVWSPYVTHRDPALWPEPDRFLPDRWASGEPEPFAYVPFGGAYRRCIGFAFALQEMKVILVQLLRRTRLRPGGAEVHPTGNATLLPNAVPVVVDEVLRANVVWNRS